MILSSPFGYRNFGGFDIRESWVEKAKAAGIHLAFSAVVLSALALVVLRAWYPDFFFATDGGWEGIRIVLAVDLVLGPLLTFVVFRRGKPGLVRDLALICAMQVAALLAGTAVVYSERPQFFVFYDGHFYSASADTYERYGVAPPDPSDYSDRTPAWVVAAAPGNPIEEAGIRRILYQDGIALWVYAPLYEPLDDEHLRDEIVPSGLSAAQMQARDPGGVLQDWLAERGKTFEDFAFVPVHSRYRDGFVAIDVESLEVGGFIDIRPPL